MPIATCPPRSALEQLFQGGLSEEAAEHVEQHVQECGACLAQLKELLSAKDTVSGAFARVDTLDDAAALPSLQQLMAKLEKLKPAAEKPRDTAAFATPQSGSPISGTDGDAPEEEEEELAVRQIAHYQLVRKLGVGGMGMVYEALDTHLERKVALKVMKPSLAKNASSRKRFLQEARSAAKIQHDHIVSIFQVGEDQGMPFLAMQLLEGASLADVLKRKGALKPSQVIRLGRQIAEGLAAAHGHGLIHRDIKPANIWIEPVHGGRVKILDFGLARLQSSGANLTQSGMIVGTPAFMAPEQARGEKDLDARVDLFSLGCVLYLMSTGVMPFKGNDPVGVLMAVQMQDPPPPRQAHGETPAALSDLIVKLLAKTPADRPASASAVVKALQEMERQPGSAASTGSLVAALAAPAATSSAETSNPFAHLNSAETQAPVSPGVATPGIPSPAPRVATRGPTGRRVAVALAACFAIAAAVFGIIHISTPEGDIVFQTDHPDFSFALNKGVVTLYDKKKPGRPYEMKIVREANGEYVLDVTDVDAELSFKTKELVIKRGQVVALKAHVERDPGEARRATASAKPGGPGALATGAPAVAPVTAAPARVIDLLKLVDVQRDAVKGAWMLGPDGLASDGSVPYCRLKFPYQPPAEYDFRVEFTAAGGNDILQILSAGGRSFTWLMGAWGGRWDGFDTVAGHPLAREGGNIIGGPTAIKRNVRHTSTIHVRKGSITALIDGKTVVVHKTDFADLGIPEPWKIGPDALGVGTTFDATVFHKAEVTEIIGDNRFTNTLGMEFALVPKGKAWFGGMSGTIGTTEGEVPYDFYLGVYELTQEEWQKVMGVNPSHFTRNGKAKDAVKDFTDADLKRFPVDNVSWDDCQEFVTRLNEQTKEAGWVYRLPTEHEWQYACRGGSLPRKEDYAFDFYLDRPTNVLLPDRANFDKNLRRPSKVGSYPCNRLGLYDMHGNMGEWCLDLFKGPGGAPARATRGGGWGHEVNWCRAVFRVQCPPWGRYGDIGLRLTRVPVP